MPYPEGGHIETADGRSFVATARRLFGNVQLDFGDDGGHARLVSAALGSSRLSELRVEPHTVRGERVVLHSDDPDSIKLIFQTRGRSSLYQDGRKTAINAAAAVIYDPTRPYALVNPTPVRLLLLQLPRRGFSSPALAALRVPFRTSGENGGVGRILCSTMQSAMDGADRLGEADRSKLGATLEALVHGMLDGTGGREPMAEPVSLGVLRRRVEAFIEANLTDPELGVADMARRMGCSPRYVFRAFAAEDTTPAEYLWELRLQRAREHLVDVSRRGKSISEIAFSLGFSSSAHFSRAFRDRYDMAPRELRKRQAAARD